MHLGNTFTVEDAVGMMELYIELIEFRLRFVTWIIIFNEVGQMNKRHIL